MTVENSPYNNLTTCPIKFPNHTQKTEIHYFQGGLNYREFSLCCQAVVVVKTLINDSSVYTPSQCVERGGLFVWHPSDSFLRWTSGLGVALAS